MNIIVCVDKNLGISFNHRRVSSDKTIMSDILTLIKGNTISISEFSKVIFNSYLGNYHISEEIPNSFSDWFFLENDTIESYQNDINTLVIYNFNRIYPSDIKLKIDLSKFDLVSSTDFPGNSHETITRIIYKRR